MVNIQIKRRRERVTGGTEVESWVGKSKMVNWGSFYGRL